MGKTIKSVLFFLLGASVLFAIWRIWGVTGQLDVLLLMIWDVLYSILRAGSDALIAAWNAVTNA